MTETYRTETLAEAKEESRKARLAFESARTLKARRAAGNDLEFWGNKVAFLSSVKGAA